MTLLLKGRKAQTNKHIMEFYINNDHHIGMGGSKSDIQSFLLKLFCINGKIMVKKYTSLNSKSHGTVFNSFVDKHWFYDLYRLGVEM